MAPEIRFRTFRNYNDLQSDNRLSLFKYLIKECHQEIVRSQESELLNHREITGCPQQPPRQIPKER